MQISAAFPSEFLKAADLQGREVKVTVDRVEMREVGDGDKPVLFFQGKEKGVVLNKTNADTLASAYGEETDGWAGQPIVLFTTSVLFEGRRVQGIRVRIPQQPRRAATAAPKAVQQLVAQSEDPGADMDDEIPF